MLHLHTWTTPNGIKPLILLEELELKYELHWVNIGKGEQLTPEFIRINPNSKIPALVDGDTVVFESGAILMHLAERTDRFLPKSEKERALTLSWLFFQVGSVGPMFGQLGFFARQEQKNEQAIDRYKK
ncbi:MAG: glutathione S-transferase N-terminal domain-containing protein, partial [Polyangiaceae bacterium]